MRSATATNLVWSQLKDLLERYKEHRLSFAPSMYFYLIKRQLKIRHNGMYERPVYIEHMLILCDGWFSLFYCDAAFLFLNSNKILQPYGYNRQGVLSSKKTLYISARRRKC
eukprot:TRINITY_DN58720_c0_g1_i1.p1 TRINITY_DN58720_c0_g1~~TRINITY_DN58720_c0_g1_i1.p1  ORF type:complete len:111 (+),score=3.47 TRINITY_DN58720_c0_g1_i1:71-403(+)